MGPIDRIGIEIEGGWVGKPGVSPFTDVALITDNSVNGQTLAGALPIAATHVGEVVSPPIPYSPQLGDLNWQAWLLSHWPNAEAPHRTNRTCGYHIHLSFFSKKAYTLLSSKVFLYQLRDHIFTLGEYHHIPEKDVFWSRINGLNTFCTIKFDAGKQMELLHKDGIHRQRYGWLNFATGIHGTLEFRALPTFFSPDLGLKFTEGYCTFVEAYLYQHAQDKIELEASF